MCKCLKNWWNNIFGEEEQEPSPPSPSPPGPVNTIRKRALLVGVDKYANPNNNLDGCVRDVTNMRNLLVNDYGFDPEEIRVLTDERATTDNIIDRLEWLVDESVKGDELVFHYSGHGSQVRDRNGDELSDGMDEILCPHDMDWDNPLTDDMLSDIFNGLAPGAYLTMIADCCHSGTITKGIQGNPTKFISKFITPPVDIMMRSEGIALKTKNIGSSWKGQNHVLLSGCKESQYSASAVINGLWQGALTYSFLKAIDANPNQSWIQVHEATVKIIKDKDFDQDPQLSGDNSLISRTVFGKI